MTPSLNQGSFLEEAIRSVLLQGWADLEYIIVDGGSRDGSLEIIRKYEPWVKSWVSEPDQGQTDALMKGFASSTGGVLGWLCADDVLLPGGINKLMQLRLAFPRSVVWAGDALAIGVEGEILGRRVVKSGGKAQMACWGVEAFIDQPACLFAAEAFRSIGGLEKRLPHLGMDLDLWMRLSDLGAITSCHDLVACSRVHRGSKSTSDALGREACTIAIAVYNGEHAAAAKELQRYVDKCQRRFRDKAARYDALQASLPLLLRHVVSRCLKALWRARLWGGRIHNPTDRRCG